MRAVTRLAAVVLVSIALPARAQEPAAPAAPPAPAVPVEQPTGAAVASPPPAPEPPDPELPVDDETWRSYHQAFQVLFEGRVQGALNRLQSLQRQRPDHPAARRAAALERALVARTAREASRRALAADAPVVVAQPEAAAPEDGATGLARAELVVFQTLHGLAAGAELCESAACAGARSHTLALMLGGGAGLGLSLGLTRGGVAPGHVQLLNTATLWGAWNGLAFHGSREGSIERDTPFGTMLVAQAAGVGFGALLWRPMRPTAGQVSLASTTGLWSGVLTMLAALALDPHMSDRRFWFTALVASDVGLFGGALLAKGAPISRGRTFLIDAGGLLGLLAGFAVGMNMESEESLFTAAFIGGGLGVAVAAVASRGWDRPAPRAHAVLSPVMGGGVTAGLGGRF